MTQEELNTILDEHEVWTKSEWTEGNKVVLENEVMYKDVTVLGLILTTLLSIIAD